jgi:hypothetical protein
MAIFNGTPHAINIITNGVSDPQIRKMVVPAGVEPEISTVIPSHGMLSAKISTVEAEPIGGIPIFSKVITGIEPIPAEYDVVIVSALYVSAARAAGLPTDKLYTVADPVYSPDGRTILGCRGICPAF